MNQFLFPRSPKKTDLRKIREKGERKKERKNA